MLGVTNAELVAQDIRGSVPAVTSDGQSPGAIPTAHTGPAGPKSR